ncbi:hypothetical protein EJB05_34558, partial [Eragrostis curvula]
MPQLPIQSIKRSTEAGALCKDTSISLQLKRIMIIVLVYTGGQVQYGETGAKYSIPPKITFPATKSTTFDDVKSEIYGGLKYSESDYVIDIQARYDVGAPGPHFFQLIPLYEERTWQMIFDMTNGRSNWHMVELYVEVTYANTGLSQIHCTSNLATTSNPIACSTPVIASCEEIPVVSQSPLTGLNQNPNINSITTKNNTAAVSTQVDGITEEEVLVVRQSPAIPVNQSSVGTIFPDYSQDWGLSGDAPRSEVRTSIEEETYVGEETDIEENISEQDDDWSQDEDEDEDEDDVDDNANGEPRVTKSIKSFPLVGRSDKHPVSAFHDISVLRETIADESFFGRKKQFVSPIAIGRTFDSKVHLQFAINEFHISNNMEVRVTTSNRKRVNYKCVDSSCKWQLYGKELTDKRWKIQTCPYIHTCRAPADRFDHKQLTAAVIADVIRDDLKENLELTILNIRQLVRQRYQSVKPHYNKLWRGRELAIAQPFGSWEASYAILTPLLEAIKATNPGTKYLILSQPTTPQGHQAFKCTAWAFGQCIEAVPHLRPVISIDSCFLSGRYRGKLLIACGYDAENRLLPIAFAIVEKEDSDNWGWFMRWLRNEVIGVGKFMCVISDRHKAIKWVFKQPHIGWNETSRECVHRFCSQHVAKNLYKQCKDDDVIKTFKWVVKKKKPRRFAEGMESIAHISPNAITYLKKSGKYLQEDKNEPEKPEKIFQCMDGGYRWGIMTSNGSESLNNVFKKSRRLPVTATVEETFNKCLEWFVDRRRSSLDLVNSKKLWSQRIDNLLIKRGNKAGSMHVTSYGDEGGEYEVKVDRERVALRQGDRTIYVQRDFKYKVILHSNSVPMCECLKPNLTSVPCSHVLAVCKHRNLDENQFVHPYYSSTTLANTWAGRFHPYGNQNEWPPYNDPVIVPESRLIQRGRRRHNRIPMYMDQMQGRRLGHQAHRSTQDTNGPGVSSNQHQR